MYTTCKIETFSNQYISYSTYQCFIIADRQAIALGI